MPDGAVEDSTRFGEAIRAGSSETDVATSTEDAPTVTVTVFSAVTVTVAGPHESTSSDPECSVTLSLEDGLPTPWAELALGAWLALLETGSGTSVTTETITEAEPVPVGRATVELNWPYGAVGPPVAKGPPLG